MSTIDHVARRQEEYQAQYDQLTARIEAVQKDLGRALESERKLILEQQLQDLIAERERVVEQMAFLEQHADDIRAGKIALPGLPEVEPAPGPSPYMGLQYFDVADAPNFFGREALTAELVGYLRDHSLLAVVGASGSGKSSVVRAGLIPALQQDQPLADGTKPPKGSDRWLMHIITPTARPLESLAASLTRDSESVTATATLIDDLAKGARSLHLYARRLLSKPNSGDRVLLVVDQFEELFTLCKDKAQRKAFVDALLTAAYPEEGAPSKPAGSVVTVVLTLRADFYANCAEFENLRATLESYQRYIGAMNREDLRRAIAGPAERGGWELEPGLVDVLLQDVGDEPGALPLLSHALLETWKRRRGRTITLAGYAASGRVQGAIAKTADDVYGAELTPKQQAIARSIFLRLTELGEGAQDTRRRVGLSELVPQDESETEVELVLQKLADARLVTTYEDEAEVAHEALIREWPALRGWLEEDREALRVQRRLGEAAREWATHGQDESYLYRGARLADAAELAGAHAGELNEQEQRFLTASLALRDREFIEQERRREQELEVARQLAAEAEARRQAEEARTREQANAAERLRRGNFFLTGTVIAALAMGVAAVAFGLQSRAQQRLAQTSLRTVQTVAAADVASYQRIAGEAVATLESLSTVQTPTPKALSPQETMSGAVNVMVAEFGQQDPASGEIRESQDARLLHQIIVDFLRREVDGANLSNIIEVGDGSRLGVVKGDTPAARAQAAAQLAARANADLLVYATLVEEEGRTKVNLEAYSSPPLRDEFSRAVQGSLSPMALPSPVGDALNEAVAAQALGDRVGRLLWLYMGLIQDQLGRRTEALAAFQHARDIALDQPGLIGGESTYYYMGREHLGLGQLVEAENLLRQALDLNPNYAPALVALGQVDSQRASDESDVSKATERLASALDLQRRGLDLARANGDQFTEIDAQIGLAETYWLWAQASEKLGDAEAALSFYDSSIRAADEALRLLGNTTAHRSLAQAYLAQGKARFGLGRIWSAQDRLVSARADLQVALQAFDRCVQEGNEAPYDAILREQIIGQGCQPLREQTQQMVEVTGPS